MHRVRGRAGGSRSVPRRRMREACKEGGASSGCSCWKVGEVCVDFEKGEVRVIL